MGMIQKQDEEIVIDIKEVIKLMFNRAFSIILCTLAFGLAVYAGVYFLVTPQYEASITMYVNNKAGADNNTTMSQSDMNASVQLVDTYSAIIMSKSVLREVIAEADVELTEEDLYEAISTSAVNDTEVFEVSVLNEDPKAAARIANSIAEIVPAQIAEIAEGSSIKVVDYADIPDEIAKPSYLKWTLLGMLFGFFLSVLIIFIRELTDNSVKSEADFSQWDYPILSTIPDLEEAGKSRKNVYGGYGHRG